MAARGAFWHGSLRERNGRFEPESAEEKAERLAAQGVKEIRWSDADLESRRKVSWAK
jgi:pyruvoyl-dependent arginine decarboxylase (PvlArgDC)